MNAANVVITKTGKIRAACEFCGRLSAPYPMRDGRARVGLSELADGLTHVDRSTGSLYTRPRCNAAPWPKPPIVPRGKGGIFEPAASSGL